MWGGHNGILPRSMINFYNDVKKLFLISFSDLFFFIVVLYLLNHAIKIIEHVHGTAVSKPVVVFDISQMLPQTHPTKTIIMQYNFILFSQNYH